MPPKDKSLWEQKTIRGGRNREFKSTRGKLQVTGNNGNYSLVWVRTRTNKEFPEGHHKMFYMNFIRAVRERLFSSLFSIRYQ